MSETKVEGKRCLITGASGMIGGLALRDCLRSPEVAEVTSIGRRSLEIDDAKLRQVVHEDFTDFSASAEAFRQQDVALFCLGVYTGAVPDEQFREITVDYTIAFAEALYAASPEATFCFLSGQGADRTETSRVAFARYKGIAENALLKIGFPRVHIFRPGYIYPVVPRREPNVAYRIMRVLYPIVRHLSSNMSVTSVDLASAMVHAGLNGTGKAPEPILENRDIREFVESFDD